MFFFKKKWNKESKRKRGRWGNQANCLRAIAGCPYPITNYKGQAAQLWNPKPVQPSRATGYSPFHSREYSHRFPVFFVHVIAFSLTINSQFSSLHHPSNRRTALLLIIYPLHYLPPRNWVPTAARLSTGNLRVLAPPKLSTSASGDWGTTREVL